jgi:peptidoglycan/xylan/chitin deacetylase (PgdA/CDA1 family)
LESDNNVPVFNTISRIQNRYRLTASVLRNRRLVELRPASPIVSFTFDDFPTSALHVGGRILKRFGVCGTYYVSLGLMGQEIPAGTAFSLADLRQVLADGHELGCHTFSHCHAWTTNPNEFENAIVENRNALTKIFPEAAFTSLSYPVHSPHPIIKRRAAKYFACCRGGGRIFKARSSAANKNGNPAYNVGLADASNLQTHFLEKNRDNPKAIKDLIDENIQARGWLILATHDVSATPSPYGCAPDFFEKIVRYAVNSGSKVLPVGRAWDLINAGNTSGRKTI